MSQSTRLLIVNADDFGLNDAATDGIAETHLAGSVTSTTLMVNAPAAVRAAEFAQAHPALGVGLHFNLTWGRPVAPLELVPALVSADGTFLERAALARRLLGGSVPRGQIQTELRAQVRALSALGVYASHVDSHQHVHGFGSVFDAVANHCSEAGIPMRVPWVATLESNNVARRVRRRILGWMLKRAVNRWRGRVAWNDDIGSVFDLDARSRSFSDGDYLQLLQRARGSSFELMVHPVTEAAAMDGYTRIGAIAEAEWRYLRTGCLAKVAYEAGFRLGNYRDLVL